MGPPWIRFREGYRSSLSEAIKFAAGANNTISIPTSLVAHSCRKSFIVRSRARINDASKVERFRPRPAKPGFSFCLPRAMLPVALPVYTTEVSLTILYEDHLTTLRTAGEVLGGAISNRAMHSSSACQSRAIL